MTVQPCVGCPRRYRSDGKVCAGQLHPIFAVCDSVKKKARSEEVKQEVRQDTVVKNGVAYRVKYPDDLGRPGVIELVVWDPMGRDGILDLVSGTFVPYADQTFNAHVNIYKTPREALLLEAMEITHKDRNKNYGNPEDNFQQIANLWNAYLGDRAKKARHAANYSAENPFTLTSADVAIMSMLIKVARLANNPDHHDSAVDVAGYAACLGDIQNKKRASGVEQREVADKDIMLQQCHVSGQMSAGQAVQHAAAGEVLGGAIGGRGGLT